MMLCFVNKEKFEQVLKFFDFYLYFFRFFYKREVSYVIMVEIVVKISKSNLNFVKEIFKMMSYGLVLEVDNVVKVC